MHIVVAGAGEVGYNVAKALCDNHDVFVIEKDEKKIDEIYKLNVEVIEGNAANINVLSKAKVSKADIFLGVTGVDEVNLLSGIAAKKMGAKKTIVRVGNPEYVDRPLVKNHPLGFDLVICPQLALARAMANIIMFSGAVDFVSLSGGKLNLIEIVVDENSVLANKKIEDLHLPENVIITAIYRDGELLVPRGQTKVLPGDKVAIVGKSQDLITIQDIFGSDTTRKVVIFGGGTVGSYLARVLDSSNLNIKLIEKNEELCENLCSAYNRVRVVIGDPTDLDLLYEEDVGRSDVVASCLENDEKNLLVSLLSKNLGTRKAIAQVSKGNYMKLFEKVGIDVVLSPRTITYLEVLKHLRLLTLETLAEIEGGEAVVLEIELENEKLSGKKISELKIPERALIGGILRGDDCLIPKGETQILKGDRLLIFTPWSEVEEIEDYFG
ncbi:K+ transport systems, NAD-binding component [Archaeoglobus sulfaticallidus PM70-1]|uniref:K+ transport systems, NAD-binding component n=1 Tax=Archaeoglobus sulfaticallidus PM70-1 TaxID=387631 RepID=N0BHA8_9EURY|nr:Trk system potassium transporter TrkA [Archaeoglobus sulfaticallidus]AGK61697.1 K+ transport systems, NAD-binding component [Archaeoglobus sulfaticallidus PM70-1]